MSDDERADLLAAAFTDEGLRRMARRAKVESVAQTGALAVNEELRLVADLMLSNLCAALAVFLDYRDVRTIDENILKLALDHLKVSIGHYSDPGDDGTYPACKTLRAAQKDSRGRAEGRSLPKASRGGTAKREVEHENRLRRDDCVYLELAPSPVSSAQRWPSTI